ncbi:MG2 domain-containing protein [Chitinophaga sedimenti]|uniref:MG2 domain-containing protein n=1 Tax=Chitinophaga sedimenti TaxID=2033606 RepID=UPI002006359F|nr:MG2 domain-containing protein [Chitinophaga sedimenti]MCK7557866.1 MG2 domain-containing protein [Chitinophaga sedimenti]
MAAARNYSYKDNWKLLREQPSVRSWAQPVPDPLDYNSHSAEVKIDALPVGQYIILAANTISFELDSSSLASHETSISSLAYFHNGNQVFVVDRESGKPVSKAKVLCTTSAKTLYTDTMGMAIIPVPLGWHESLVISKDDDTLRSAAFYPRLPTSTPNNIQVKTWFFTDRSIYRPGQTVYFKGIVTEHNAAKAGKDKLKASYTSRIALLNANGDEVDSIKVKTNEYGSYAGSLKIPTGLLNGEFQIEDEEEGRVHSIKVEEYKRPKFSIAFDTIRVHYRAGDTIHLKGTATALSGAVVDGAQVEYKVTLPRTYNYYGRGIAPGAQQEELVAKGETFTDSAGNFYLHFPTDTGSYQGSREMATYVVNAGVTDRNGETREEQQYVSVARKGVAAQISVMEDAAKDTVRLWTGTQNLAGYRIAVPVTVRITRLQPPATIKRDRLWQVPDQFVMSQEEFEKYFPYDHYKAALTEDNWPRAEQVWSKSYDSIGSLIKVNVKDWKDGVYLFELAGVDARGDTVYQKTTKLLEDESKPSITVPAYLWSSQNNTAGKPGEKVSMAIGTSAQHVNVLELVTRRNKQTINWMHLSQEKKRTAFTLTNEDRDGLEVDYVFVKDNRLYSTRRNISVQWDNTVLGLRFATFRSKLEPGEKQTWTINIRDEKQQKVAAEMLAAMYDASLDQLYLHYWTTPSFVSVPYRQYSRWSNDGFGAGYSQGWNLRPNSQQLTKPFYDAQLNWFGWNYLGRADGRINNKGYGLPTSTLQDSLNEVVVVGYGAQQKGV